jgi:hypothetical protein
MFLREKPPDQFVAMIREVELELQQPTQQVCQIIDNLASEENCRLYLTAFVTFVREALRKSQRRHTKLVHRLQNTDSRARLPHRPFQADRDQLLRLDGKLHR